MTDTYVGVVAGEQLLIQIGDGGVPGPGETFAHPCLINTERGIAFTSNMTETEVANCTDPSKPAQLTRRVKTTDFTITGAGKVDATGVYAFLQWWQSGVAKNITANQNLSGAAGGWNGVGPAILKDFDVKGAARDTQDFTATFVPAGTWTWTQNA